MVVQASSEWSCSYRCKSARFDGEGHCSGYGKHKGSLEKILKKKRRKGYKKTVQHKQPYTRLRIEEIQIQPN